jgi:glycosyltransferase involved in cell wall biosynthesis
MRTEVEAAIADRSYSDRIYLAGNVEHAVTLHLINNADILLRTTLFDGDAISVREAIYLGTSVIATDNGMRPNGVHLIPMGSKDALVAKVTDILSTPAAEKIVEPADTTNISAVTAIYHALIN